MNAAEWDPLLHGPADGRMYGVYPAVVTSVQDPDAQGRVRVLLPWLPPPGSNRFEAWARLATLMAGHGHGTFFVPDVGDEVLVAFQGGEPTLPFVIGALWNGKDAPPVTMDGAGANNLRTIRTRSGITIEFDDDVAHQALTISTPGGSRIRLDDGGAEVTIEDRNRNSLRMDANGVSVHSIGELRVDASEVTIGTAKLRVNAGVVEITGALKADTIVTRSVVSAAYTPGSGNIW